VAWFNPVVLKLGLLSPPEPALRLSTREPRTQNPVPGFPPVPTFCVTPPPPLNPYEAALVSQCTLPQLQNAQGRFTHWATANTLRPAVFTPEGSPTGTISSLPSSSAPSSPSSVTFSDIPFPSGTPATSPAPQTSHSVTPSPWHIMSDHKGSLQWEGSTDDKLSVGQFLQEIENKIDERGHAMERLKMNCLKNNIAYGSNANEWFSNLDAVEKDTYDHLVDAFQKQWPRKLSISRV